MSACDSGDVLAKTGCILSYNGNLADILINYILFALNLAWCIIALHLHTTDISKRFHLRRFAIGSLLFGA
jgi:cell division protein ZapA (FtsZ GTPase activity inhibitor)